MDYSCRDCGEEVSSREDPATQPPITGVPLLSGFVTKEEDAREVRVGGKGSELTLFE